MTELLSSNPNRIIKGDYAKHTNKALCDKLVSKSGTVDDYVDLIMDLVYTKKSTASPTVRDMVPG